MADLVRRGLQVAEDPPTLNSAVALVLLVISQHLLQVTNYVS